eukprot:TRINITY_DN2162_c0_g1_i2.p1 TRINITY_DN2162_c0_g1~~TRINITY_DN2162_c0_g1_i2.p1  ORF type:complete len:260 (-),score=21.15 TRINITY_DN2162_c0_g1_i2:104-883(-)
MSVEAGNDYTSKELFAQRFPGMVKRGFRMNYELIGHRGWSKELQWGYMVSHVNIVHTLPPAQVYADLLELVKDKDYFVITSNVDRLFANNGFDAQRIFTPQGDFDWLQCSKPCSDQVWPSQPVVDRILPVIDKETHEVTDPSVIPSCPNCGSAMTWSVRGGDYFLENPYAEQERRSTVWIESAISAGSLVILEIGAGFNTPTVIRGRNETLAYRHPDAVRLIRVNLQYPQIPWQIESNAVGLSAKASDALHALKSSGEV